MVAVVTNTHVAESRPSHESATMTAPDEELQKLGKLVSTTGKMKRASGASRREATSPSCRESDRERTSVGSCQRKLSHERSTGMASADCEVRSKHRSTSAESHEPDTQRRGLSFRTLSVRDPTGRMKRTLASGKRYQVTPSTRRRRKLCSWTQHLQRCEFQVQTLDTYEVMTAVTFQFW